MSADPRLVDSRLASIVVLLALLLDVGWCLERPDLSLPGLVVGLPLQLFVAISVSSTCSFHALQQWALFCWIVSSGFWTFGELLWDEVRPVGFLNRVPMLVAMDNHLVGYLVVSAVILWSAFFALFAALILGRSSFMTSANGTFKFDVQDLELWWFTLWMLSDAAWNVCDIFFASGRSATVFSVTGTVAGAASLVLIASCVRKHALLGDRTAAASSVGEFMWVAGNMVWFIDDLIEGDESEYVVKISAFLMCIGMASCLASVLGCCRGPSEQPLLSEDNPPKPGVELRWECSSA